MHDPTNHECLPEAASRLTAERFVAFIETHPEIQDLIHLTEAGPIIFYPEENE